MTSKRSGTTEPFRSDRIWVDPVQRSVLHVKGEADLRVVQEFADSLGVEMPNVGRTLAQAGVKEVDLSRAAFIDSALIALLASIARHSAPERVHVRGARSGPALVLDITGLASVVDMDTPSRGQV